MKKINLKGISEVLSERELKNIMGGSNNGCKFDASPCSGSCTIPGTGLSGNCGTYTGGGISGCACIRKSS